MKVLTAQEIAQALSHFADPGTNLMHRELDNSTYVELTRDGEAQQYRFDNSSGRITSGWKEDKSYIDFRSLLASPEFADMRWMTETQKRLISEHRAALILEPSGYIEEGDHTTELTPQSLRALLRPMATTANSLKIALIDGPAGVGKTTLIRAMLEERAIKTESLAPLLHVTSRGRRLTNLADALAQATQAVRARFTYDQVPTLVRYGVLQLAIDGFDELVDADGYKDAWYALSSFFDEIGCGGPIILSGRDTFFDEQSFRSRLTGSPTSFELSQIHLTSVSPDRAEAFLIRSGWESDEVRAGSHDYLRQGSYVLRPFFLTQIAHAGSWDAFSPPVATFRTFLVDRLIIRESKLISDMVRLSPESSEALLWRLFEELALDMADNESDSIDIDVVALLVELVFEKSLSADDLGKLRSKAGSFASLEIDQRPSRRRFIHSEIANIFLARALFRTLGESSIARSMRRGIIGTDLQEAIQDVGSTLSKELLSSVRIALERSMADAGLSDRLATNLAIIRFSISELISDRVTIANVSIDELRSPETLPMCELRNVQIGRLDARDSDISSCVFLESNVGTLVVTDISIVDDRIFTNIASLERHFGDRFEAIYDPTRIREWIRSHSRSHDLDSGNAGESSNESIRLLDRICRKAMRVFYISEEEDRSGPSMLQNPSWPIVRDVLRKYDRLDQRSNLGARGPAKNYYHVVDAAALLDSNDEISNAVRSELLQLG